MLEKIKLYIILSLICLLIGAGTVFVIIYPKFSAARNEAQYYRNVLDGYNKQLTGELKSFVGIAAEISREASEQRRNRELALDAINRAIESNKLSSSAIERLGKISREEREILAAINRLNTENLTYIRELVKRSGSDKPQ